MIEKNIIKKQQKKLKKKLNDSDSFYEIFQAFRE